MSPLPEALEAFLDQTFPEPVARARALHAPIPYLGWRAAIDEPESWDPPGERSAAFERNLEVEAETLRDLDRPFFDAPGCEGSLHSPFPELTDAEYWRFHEFIGGGEDLVVAALEQPLHDLGGVSSLQFLRQERSPTALGWLRSVFGKRRDPRIVLWEAHAARFAGNYR